MNISNSLFVDYQLISLYANYKIVDNNTSYYDDTITTSSRVIDVTDIISRHNTVKRRVSIQKVFESYVMSMMIRCGLKVLKLAGSSKLIRQEERNIIDPFSSYYFTDNNTFLWTIEHVNKWSFRIHCQIKVAYN